MTVARSFTTIICSVSHLCWNVCHFSVSFSKICGMCTYFFYQCFLHIFPMSLPRWSILNCCCRFSFWFVSEWELFRAQKCEKDKYSWNSNFSYNIMSTKRIHYKAVNQENVNTPPTSSQNKCTREEKKSTILNRWKHTCTDTRYTRFPLDVIVCYVLRVANDWTKFLYTYWINKQ